jgi:pSer/pThr/pTyr-binding forkhead associated (FHA) protein
MYIEFLEGTALWYWYNYGGVIAGMSVTVMLTALIVGLSNWNTGGILLKTVIGASLISVLPLGLARLGFTMAISNPELVGYLSIGGTAVALTVTLAYVTARAISKSSVNNMSAVSVGQEMTQAVGKKEFTGVQDAPAPKLNFHLDNDKTVAVSADSVTIGRDKTNDIVLDHPSVSRKHARLNRRDNRYYIEDLGSINGVKVNGVAADGSEVKQGAVMKFGKVEVGVGTPMATKSPVNSGAVAKNDDLSDVTYVGKPKSQRIGWLTVNGGENAGQVFYLNPGSNVLGRGSTNEIVIDDTYVSSIQCDLKVDENEVTLFDLGSRTGTKVNQRVLNGRIVNPGSTIKVGDTELKMLKIDNPEQFESVVDMENTQVDMQGEKTVVLVAVSGPDAGKSYTLVEGSNIVGRNSGSQIQLSDKSVSRRHAMIKCESGTLRLFDMGSSTGTKLDNINQGGTKVSTGDIIKVGRTEMTFVAATA